MAKTQRPVARPSNRLLALLPQAEYLRLNSHLQIVSLAAKQIVYKAHSRIDFVYFPTNCMISAMTIMEDGSAIEVATIGNEGMTGATAFAGGLWTGNEFMVQVGGEGLRMSAEVLKNECLRDGPLRQLLAKYQLAYSMQISYCAACNGLHKIEQRCSRWLLMTTDRAGSDVLPLTHEFLAIMLGVRRSSVTEVLRSLQKRGLIRTNRGEITIVDRPGLESASCECYRAVKNVFRSVFA